MSSRVVLKFLTNEALAVFSDIVLVGFRMLVAKTIQVGIVNASVFDKLFLLLLLHLSSFASSVCSRDSL